jgi:hypothetical protein
MPIPVPDDAVPYAPPASDSGSRETAVKPAAKPPRSGFTAPEEAEFKHQTQDQFIPAPLAYLMNVDPFQFNAVRNSPVGTAYDYVNRQGKKVTDWMDRHPYYTALASLLIPGGEVGELGEAGEAVVKPAAKSVLEAMTGPTARRWLENLGLRHEGTLQAVEKAGPKIAQKALGAGSVVASVKGSQLAQEGAHALFPNHPMVAEGAGLVAGLGVPMGIEAYGVPKAESMFGGEGTLRPEMEAASAKARDRFTKATQSADEAARRETESQQDKAVGAGQRAQDKAEAARTKFVEKATDERQTALDKQREDAAKVTFGKAEAEHAQRQAAAAEEEQIKTDEQAARDKHATKYRKEAAKDAIQQEVDEANQDRKGKPVFDNTMPSGPLRSLRDRIFRRATKAPVTAYRENWRSERDQAIPDTIKDERPTNYDPLIRKMDEEQNEQRDEQGNVIAPEWKNRPVNPKVRGFFDRVRSLVAPTDADVLAAQGKSPQEVRNFLAQAEKEAAVDRTRAYDPAEQAQYDSMVGHRFEPKTPEQAHAKILERRYALSPARWEIEQAHAAHPPASIRDLLKVQREAKGLILRERDPTNQVAIEAINDGIDDNIKAHVDSLPPERAGEANLQRLQELNEEYFNHRNNFTPALERRLNQFERPVDASNVLLTQHPQAALELIQHSKLAADDGFGTRMELRDQIAANVKENGPQWINNVDQKILDELFPETSDLRNKDSWIRNDKNIKAAAAAIEANPRLKQSFLNDVMQDVGDRNRRLADITVKLARRDAHLLGPALERQLKFRIRSAEEAPPDVLIRERVGSNAELAARKASEFIAGAEQTHALQQQPPIPDTVENQLKQQPPEIQNPDLARQQAEAAYPQQTTAREQAAAAREEPRLAPPGGVQGLPDTRDNLQRRLDPSGGGGGSPEPMTRQEALESGAAVQNFQRGYKERQFFTRWKNRAGIWALVDIAMPMMSRFSGFALTGFGAFTGLVPGEMMYRGLREAMAKDPILAQDVEHILRNPTPYLSRPNALTRAIGRSIIAEGLAKTQVDQEILDEYERGASLSRAVEKYSVNAASATSGSREEAVKGNRHPEIWGTPTPLFPTPSPSPGPGVSAADRMRSENVAPSRSSADSAQKLAMNVSKPTSPVDVSRDLASGRHSVDEVRKTLQFHNDPKATDVLAGMPLTDAMMATELASPEERPMLMQVLQTRLRQELPQVKNKTTQANLTKRMKQLQSMGETAVA